MGGLAEIAVEQMLVDGDGSESGGCNVAQVTPSTEIRECANSICVEDACGRWIALLETEEGAAPMALEDVMALMASMVAPMASMAMVRWRRWWWLRWRRWWLRWSGDSMVASMAPIPMAPIDGGGFDGLGRWLRWH